MDEKILFELFDLLEEIDDSEEYILGVANAAGNDMNRELLVSYLKAKKERGIIPDSSKVIKIAIYMRRKNPDGNNRDAIFEGMGENKGG